MPGMIFYRERRKVAKGDKAPRFTIAAVYNADIKFFADHFKKSELEYIAKATGSKLVLLESEKESNKYSERDK